MIGMVLHARFDGKVLVPVGPVELPTDRVLELEVREVSSTRKGSAQAILQAMSEPPHLDQADGDALLNAIESAQLPIQPNSIFDEPKPAV
jgi:hypothetical protein